MPGKGEAKGEEKGKAKGEEKGDAKGQAKGEAKSETKTKGKVCLNREHTAYYGHCKGQGRFCHLIFVGSLSHRCDALGSTPKGLDFLFELPR